MRHHLLWITLSLAAPALGRASILTLTFEGLQDRELVEGFYNGGLGSQGSGPGPSFGVLFSGATAHINSDLGGSGDFGGEPSPSTAIFSASRIFFSVPLGFDTGLSFFYANWGGSTEVRVYSTAAGTGPWLADQLLAATPAGSSSGSPKTFSPMLSSGFSFSGTARSVEIFSRGPGGFYLDNVTLGSQIPASPDATPEPATSLLLATGLAGLAGLAAYRETRHLAARVRRSKDCTASRSFG